MSPKKFIELIQQDPGACWFTSDVVLAEFVKNLALHDRAHAEIEAELVARWWARKHAGQQLGGQGAIGRFSLPPDSPEWLEFISGVARDFQVAQPFGPICVTELGQTGAYHWGKRFRSRVDRFLRAEGFIALSLGKEGCLLPFEIQHLQSDHWRFVDVSGAPVLPEWSASAAELDRCVSGAPYQIFLNGPFVDLIPLEGNSFGFAVVLASFLRDLPRFIPSTVVATGEVKDGRLLAVARCEEKRLAAVRLGARLFVCPACDLAPRKDIETLEIQCGSALGEAKLQVQKKLQEMGLLPIDAPHAIELLGDILSRGNVGPGNPAESIPKIQNAIAALEETLREPGVVRPERLQRHLRDGTLHLASLHNHAGNPREARALLEKLVSCSGISGSVSNPKLWESAARLIVSLADEGSFKKAWLVAERTLERADNFSQENDSDLRVQMELYGALGCDLLPQMALRLGGNQGAETAAKMREFQLLNIRIARELQHAQIANFNGNKNLAKSAVRSVLVSALINPAETEHLTAEVLRECASLPGWEESAPYLARVRFLGEYRRLLFAGGQPTPLAWEEELPGAMPGGGEWVHATALKYRAAIRACNQQMENAAVDFTSALRVLAFNQYPVIRLIRWSIAAEAWCSLPSAPLEVRETLVSDRMVVVEYLERFEPSRNLSERIKGIELESEKTSKGYDVLREFQLKFAY